MKIEKSSYRGYQLTVTDLSILVRTPAGSRLGSVKAMSSARRMVQRHRSATQAGERGQALIEYALIISLICLVSIVALSTSGVSLSSILHAIAGEL